jgi:hypothetical protein
MFWFFALIAVGGIIALAFAIGLSYIRWRAFLEVGLGPWASAGAVIVAWVVLGLLSRIGGKKECEDQ